MFSGQASLSNPRKMGSEELLKKECFTEGKKSVLKRHSAGTSPLGLVMFYNAFVMGGVKLDPSY